MDRIRAILAGRLEFSLLHLSSSSVAVPAGENNVLLAVKALPRKNQATQLSNKWWCWQREELLQLCIEGFELGIKLEALRVRLDGRVPLACFECLYHSNIL